MNTIIMSIHYSCYIIYIFSHQKYDVIHFQGSHRLEKYLNLEVVFGLFFLKSLKIKSILKNTEKSLKGLEKSLNVLLMSPPSGSGDIL